MAGRLALLLAVAVTAAAGYGGFEFIGSLVDYTPEAQRLTELNRFWEGTGQFRPTPVVWLGGHGGGHSGPVTVGGRGALAMRWMQADAVEAQFAGVQGALDVGYHYAPLVYLALRPGFELSGAGWGYYVHDRESPFADPGFSQWYVGWTAGVMPALEVMGRLPRNVDQYVGLFVKAGWFFPLYGPAWYLDAPPPGLDLKGFQLQVGLRFGRLPPTHLRI